MRKIAIVARAPSTRYRAPFHEQDWEIWTLSPMGAPHFSDLPRWDRFYELHNLHDKEAEVPGVVDYLGLYGDRVWIREPHPRLPDAQIYPRENIFDHFQANFANPFLYYNNQVSLMMAHAIYEGCDELALYGVDMSQSQEYMTQKPSCEVFIGYAAGAGVKVTIPEQSDLCKLDRVYGLEDEGWREMKAATHKLEMETRLARLYGELDDAKKQQVGAAAAAGELQQLMQSMNGQMPTELRGAIEMRLGSLKQVHDVSREKSDQLDQDIKLSTGAIEELRYLSQFI